MLNKSPSLATLLLKIAIIAESSTITTAIALTIAVEIVPRVMSLILIIETPTTIVTTLPVVTSIGACHDLLSLRWW